ncbi:SprT family zinc-dependent metalloprotease [Sphingomonas naphthae]|uniref:SprT family zinc-dependent metalloprotease n=1 Tax=Sphingomonas naphthae TaxID=1813468 RepID=A0ABY7TLW6_9SPHN|nr:SprT family zinc-dependent metalloprotease [Sphingomonas naphthae]WCT73244.1 SprT family zinc-dependent metalloprotease [Sphingomonas naphthae]
MSSIASSDLTFAGGGHVRDLVVRRMAQARRMRLSVDPRDGAVTLVLPRRAALRPALAWAEGQRGWIEAALAAIPATLPLGPGATLPVRGRMLTIDWAAARPRTVRIEGDRLVTGGPLESIGPRILRWLRAEALAELTVLTHAYCDKAGVARGPVGVGDPRSRWGSCSSSGGIRYSWRLILAPPAVLEATVAHEVGHRLHMDHSRAFHAAVARLLGREPVAERAWLRAHGVELHAVGRV